MRIPLRKILGVGLIGVMLATPLVFAQPQRGAGQQKKGQRGGPKKGGKKGPMVIRKES